MSWDLEDEEPTLSVDQPVLIKPDVVYVPAGSMESRDPVKLAQEAQRFVDEHPDFGPGTAVERVDTRPHGTQLISHHDPQDPYGMRMTGEGPESPGVFLFVGEKAERHNRGRAQALDHERGEELAKRDDELGKADELERAGDGAAAEEAYKDADLHEGRAAAVGTEADSLRYEAATSYSTTVAGPPGPKKADAAQQQSASPKVNQVKQPQQAPTRRVR